MEKERVRAWPVWDFKERIVNSQIYIFYCDSPVIMNKFKRRRSAFLYFYWRINFVIRLFSNKIVKYLVSHDAEGRRKKFIDKKSLEGNKKLISITEEPTGHEKRIARLSSHGASLFSKKNPRRDMKDRFSMLAPKHNSIFVSCPFILLPLLLLILVLYMIDIVKQVTSMTFSLEYGGNKLCLQ